MKKTIFLVITVFALLFAGCKSGGGGDPKLVLNKFIDAMAAKNLDEARKYITRDSEGMMGMLEMAMNNMPADAMEHSFKKENMDLGEAVIDGDNARVPVKEKTSGEVIDFMLKKESGEWKVAFDMSTLMEMGQKKMKEHGNNIDMKNMDSMIGNLNMDSLQNQLQKVSKEDVEKAKKLMDSASKMLRETQKNSK